MCLHLLCQRDLVPCSQRWQWMALMPACIPMCFYRANYKNASCQKGNEPCHSWKIIIYSSCVSGLKGLSFSVTVLFLAFNAFYHEYLRLLVRKDWYHYGKGKSTKIPIRPVYHEILQLLVYYLSIIYLYSQNDIVCCVELIS